MKFIRLGILLLFSLMFLISEVFAAIITYSYDSRGRVTGAFYSNGTEFQYTYDNAGNRRIEQVDSDVDGDGLLDAVENAGCTDPYDADTDDDGIIDGDEDLNKD